MFKGIRHAIDQNEGGLDKFSEGVHCTLLAHLVDQTVKFTSLKESCAHEGYKFYGLNRGECEGKVGIWYREWAPGARV